MNTRRDEIADETIRSARQGIEDARGPLERQRRRVARFLVTGEPEREEARELLHAMERSFALKEVCLDYLLSVSGTTEGAGRLHPYDIEQRAQRFGITHGALLAMIEKVGAVFELIEAEIAALPGERRVFGSSTTGAPASNKK